VLVVSFRTRILGARGSGLNFYLFSSEPTRDPPSSDAGSEGYSSVVNPSHKDLQFESTAEEHVLNGDKDYRYRLPLLMMTRCDSPVRAVLSSIEGTDNLSLMPNMGSHSEYSRSSESFHRCIARPLGDRGGYGRVEGYSIPREKTVLIVNV